MPLRNSIPILILLALTACGHKNSASSNNPIPLNSKRVELKFIDSLGSISFNIPNEYDTSFEWTNWSDCGKPCAHEQYRFQSTSYPIFKETGFIYKVPQIEINQFTIIHSSYLYRFHEESDSSNATIHHFHFKARTSSHPDNPRVIFDTLENINGKYFSILIMDTFDIKTQMYIKKVAGLTTIKGNEVEFHYDLSTKDSSAKTRQFIDNSIKFMRSINSNNGI